MSTYKEIRGLKVRDYTTNPDNPIEGQLWYNETDNVAKYQIPNLLASWRTGNNLNNSKLSRVGGGTQTAGIVFGGEPASGVTETYDGTTYTEVADMNTGRYSQGGNGSQTSALVYAGNPGTVALAESWNGSSWTEVGDLNSARYALFGFGADNTSALAFGGYDTASRAYTESWNGSAWTEVADLNLARFSLGGLGIATAGLAFAGANPPPGLKTETEEWNGSSWTEVADLKE